MNTKIPIGLIIVSIMAILIDCYAGYMLFMMTAMPIGHYLSPFLLLALVLFVPTLFIASIINLFRLKKWAYRVFFTLTFIFNLVLISLEIRYIYIFSLAKKRLVLETQQIFLIVSFLIFLIYFFRPSIRRLFR